MSKTDAQEIDEGLDHLERAAVIAASLAAFVKADVLRLRPGATLAAMAAWTDLERKALAYGAEIEAYKP